MRNGLVKILVVLVIAYGVAAGYMYVNQRSFLFVPTGELETPEDKGLDAVTVETAVMADGTEIPVWRAEPSAPGAPTVLYFHGNSSSLSARWRRFKQILEGGYGLYAPSYRGYPGSGGSPSEKALLADALEHFDRLAGAGGPVILHGESLGTGVASAVAAERQGAGLVVLEAPYTALVDLAADQYPWLPVELLMKDPMKTRERIGALKAPLLIVHGTEDRIIPPAHGRRLYDLAPEPKDLLFLEGAGHGDLWDKGLFEAVKASWAKVNCQLGMGQPKRAQPIRDQARTALDP